MSGPAFSDSPAGAPYRPPATPWWRQPVVVLPVLLVVVVAAVVGVVLANRSKPVPAAGPSSTPTPATTPSGPRSVVTLTAAELDGQPPSAADLAATMRTIRRRLTAAGISGAEVSSPGPTTIVLSLPPGVDPAGARPLYQPGQVTFRKVLDDATDGSPPAIAMNAGADAIPAALRAKIGAAADTADQVVNGTLVLSGPPPSTLDAFRLLTSTEVAQLPPAYQFDIPQISCAMLAGRPITATAAAGQPIVVCQDQSKFYLDVAKVQGSDLATATAGPPGPNNPAWSIALTFTDAGTARWTALSREAYTNAGGACRVTRPGIDAQSQVCQVAIVDDGTVLAAPAIEGVLGRNAVISGQFDELSARRLAAQLSFGPLPLVLT